MNVLFVETEIFTRRITALGLEESLRQLQTKLTAAPEAGDLDPGTGGLRKVRMGDPQRSRGTRGGARVHYLWLPHVGVIYLMFVYLKEEAETLTRAQKQALAAVVREIKAEHRRRRL